MSCKVDCWLQESSLTWAERYEWRVDDDCWRRSDDCDLLMMSLEIGDQDRCLAHLQNWIHHRKEKEEWTTSQEIFYWGIIMIEPCFDFDYVLRLMGGKKKWRRQKLLCFLLASCKESESVFVCSRTSLVSVLTTMGMKEEIMSTRLQTPVSRGTTRKKIVGEKEREAESGNQWARLPDDSLVSLPCLVLRIFSLPFLLPLSRWCEICESKFCPFSSCSWWCIKILPFFSWKDFTFLKGIECLLVKHRWFLRLLGTKSVRTMSVTMTRMRLNRSAYKHICFHAFLPKFCPPRKMKFRDFCA